MRRNTLWGALASAVLLLAPAAARAQIYTDFHLRAHPAGRDNQPPGDDKKKEFYWVYVGSYYSFWDVAPAGKVRVGTPNSAVGTRGIGVLPDPNPGPLVTGDVYLTRNLALGAWWNPFDGDMETAEDFTVIESIGGGATRRRTIRAGAELGTFNANMWDVHLTYNVPSQMLSFLPGKFSEGWAIQGGYTVLSYNFDAAGTFFRGRRSEHALSQKTANLWVSKSHPLTSFRAFGNDVGVSLFGSAGYYFANSFDNAFNLIGGVSLRLTPTVSLSGSAWLNDVGGADNLRLNFGVSTAL